MLVQCGCGKKLRVKENLIGKKVKCPACAKVFIAEEVNENEEEGIVADTRQNKGRSRRDDPEAAPKKKKGDESARDDLEEDDLAEDDDRPARKRKRRKKAVVSLGRNIAAGVVLCVLVVVAAVLYWQKLLTPSGSVTLEAAWTKIDIFIDDRKIDFSVPPGANALSVTVDLKAGSHTVKVTKDGFHPFIRQFDVKSGENQIIQVELRLITNRDSSSAPDWRNGTHSHRTRELEAIRKGDWTPHVS